jgi:hypothetical protein
MTRTTEQFLVALKAEHRRKTSFIAALAKAGL